jgi:hypothetical protein
MEEKTRPRKDPYENPLLSSSSSSSSCNRN